MQSQGKYTRKINKISNFNPKYLQMDLFLSWNFFLCMLSLCLSHFNSFHFFSIFLAVKLFWDRTTKLWQYSTNKYKLQQKKVKMEERAGCFIVFFMPYRCLMSCVSLFVEYVIVGFHGQTPNFIYRPELFKRLHFRGLTLHACARLIKKIKIVYKNSVRPHFK